jgi:hypothetical protein
MKIFLYAATAVLVAIQSMTAIIGWPGGDAYSRVVKPYPSLLKQIPHMEERGWRDALASGELPRWVAQSRYIELARSGDEVDAPLPVRVYVYSQLLTLFALVASAAALIQTLRKRMGGKNGSPRS